MEDKLEYLSYIFTAILAGLAGFLASYGKEKGKNYANKEDFEKLTEQLAGTTEVVESIKSTVSDRSWINQQVWVKKQEIYESIFEKLLLIKKYTSHQSNEFNEYVYLEREHEYYLSHEGIDWEDNPFLKRDLERKKEEYKKQKSSDEHQAEVNKIHLEKEQAIAWLMETASMNSVYIDSDVQLVLTDLQKVLKRSYDRGEFDEVEDYIWDVCKAVEDAIESIKTISRAELKIET